MVLSPGRRRAEQQVPWMLSCVLRSPAPSDPLGKVGPGWTQKQVLGGPADLLTGDDLERMSGVRLEKPVFLQQLSLQQWFAILVI